MAEGAKSIDISFRRIISIGVPSLGSVILPQLYQLTDASIVGHVGTKYLGALGLGQSTVSFIFAPLISLNFAVISRAARERVQEGTRSESSVIDTTNSFVAISILAALLLVIGGLLVVPHLAPTREVGRSAANYCYIIALSFPATFAISSLMARFNGSGKNVKAMIVLLSSLLLNLGLEVIFVFILRLNVVGSALGTLIADFTTALWLLRDQDVPLPSPRSILKSLKREREFIGIALIPLISRSIFLVLALSGSIYVAGHFGTLTLATYSLGETLWLALGMGFDALAVPAQVIISEAREVGDLQSAKVIDKNLTLAGIAIAVLIGALAILLRSAIAHLITPDKKLIAHLSYVIVAVAISLAPTAVSFVADGIIAAFDDYRALRVTTAASFFVMAISFTVIIATVGEVTYRSIWIPFLLWIATRAVASYFVTLRLMRRFSNTAI
ncbi:MAG: MATE family efflux transporter [Actinomycetota bacterium]|nr:MATE family efflux transporter [Actinomycetota bacterium]